MGYELLEVERNGIDDFKPGDILMQRGRPVLVIPSGFIEESWWIDNEVSFLMSGCRVYIVTKKKE